MSTTLVFRLYVRPHCASSVPTSPSHSLSCGPGPLSPSRTLTREFPGATPPFTHPQRLDARVHEQVHHRFELCLLYLLHMITIAAIQRTLVLIKCAERPSPNGIIKAHTHTAFLFTHQLGLRSLLACAVHAATAVERCWCTRSSSIIVQYVGTEDFSYLCNDSCNYPASHRSVTPIMLIRLTMQPMGQFQPLTRGYGCGLVPKDPRVTRRDYVTVTPRAAPQIMIQYMSFRNKLQKTSTHKNSLATTQNDQKSDPASKSHGSFELNHLH